MNGLAQRELAVAALEQRGATQVIATSYRSAYALTRQEISAGWRRSAFLTTRTSTTGCRWRSTRGQRLPL